MGNRKQVTKSWWLTLLIHVLAGMFLFYFVLHPLLMVVYAGHGADAATTELGERIIFQLKHAFSFHMLPMAYVFIIAGAFVGLLSAFFWMDLARKRRVTTERRVLSSSNVEELITSGENHYVEFKSSIRYDFRQKSTNRNLEEVIAKTIAGFMNTLGGHLLIGVDDSGKIVGLENDFITLRHKNEDGFELRIFDLITTSLGAEFCHLCSVSFRKLNGKTICLVQITSSAEPVYLNHLNNTDFYIRAGNATRHLSVKETVQYLKMKETKGIANNLV